jgi:mono/diheme cytochrome c family protein
MEKRGRKPGSLGVGPRTTVLLGCMLGCGFAVERAEAGSAHSVFTTHPSGREAYSAACAACHGEDGRGAAQTRTGLDLPVPDFTDCGFTRREPDQDWRAVIHHGGPARGFDESMPAFGRALSDQEIIGVLRHVRGFCTDGRWPKGELNLPRALFTEKAFPEDEVVLTSELALGGPLSASQRLIYEQRVGPVDQFEVVFPFSVHDQAPYGIVAGAGDLGLGWKHVLLHSMRRGSILSAIGEVFLPTGSPREGFGKGTFLFEPSLAYGQLLPPGDGQGRAFVQLQGGFELPARTNHAEPEFYLRGLVGMSASEHGWGRTWSPIWEFIAVRSLAGGARTEWDFVPQLQVTLSQRGHVRFGGGMRRPLTGLAERRTTAVAYLLWDWFDGGLSDGW